MTSRVFTGFGYWDVWTWIAFALVAAAVAGWIRSQGRKDYKEGTDQDEIFFGGNPVPEDGADYRVPASSAYWGFTRALEGYYRPLLALHSGVATEYVGMMVAVIALMAVLVLL